MFSITIGLIIYLTIMVLLFTWRYVALRPWKKGQLLHATIAGNVSTPQEANHRTFDPSLYPHLIGTVLKNFDTGPRRDQAFFIVPTGHSMDFAVAFRSLEFFQNSLVNIEGLVEEFISSISRIPTSLSKGKPYVADREVPIASLASGDAIVLAIKDAEEEYKLRSFLWHDVVNKKIHTITVKSDGTIRKSKPHDECQYVGRVIEASR